MLDAKDIRDRHKEDREISQELRVSLRPLLHTPGWQAYERWIRFELEGLMESLAYPNESFDMVRYKQGQIYRLQEMLQLKSELLKSEV